MFQALTSPTERGQLVLHLQHDSLPDVLQQADDLIVAELWQVDAVHRLDVVSYIQLVASCGKRRTHSHIHSDGFCPCRLVGDVEISAWFWISTWYYSRFNILNVQTSVIWLVMMNPLIIIKDF